MTEDVFKAFNKLTPILVIMTQLPLQLLSTDTTRPSPNCGAAKTEASSWWDWKKNLVWVRKQMKFRKAIRPAPSDILRARQFHNLVAIFPPFALLPQLFLWLFATVTIFPQAGWYTVGIYLPYLPYSPSISRPLMIPLGASHSYHKDLRIHRS